MCRAKWPCFVFLLCLLQYSLELPSSSNNKEHHIPPTTFQNSSVTRNSETILNSNENDAKAFLTRYDQEFSKLQTEATRASWSYNTNLTDHNANILEDIKARIDSYSDEAYRNSTMFNSTSFGYDTRRLLKRVGSPSLSPQEMKELSQIENEMARLYSSYQVSVTTEFEVEELSPANTVGDWCPGQHPVTRNSSSWQFKMLDRALWVKVPRSYRSILNANTATAGLTFVHQVCKDDKLCFSLEPEISNIMSRSTNASERLWIWRQWHEGVGRAIRPLYIKYTSFRNRLAKLKGFADYGDAWRQNYEISDLDAVVRDLYQEIEPLYRHLHAYVRRRLYNVYGPEIINLRGPLPAHLLGDLWGRFWSGLNDIVQPYPNKTSFDPTQTMIDQNYTVKRMFDMGNDFFLSMGLKPIPKTFFDLSMLEKPNDPDRKVVCHATAWDFNDGKDFRIKMCTQVNFDDFLTIHHELGHTQYQMQYAHLPLGYRDGANDGFHEAIGELMSMSVATKKHLLTIGLLNNTENDPETEINFLMTQALRSVTTLPFHLVQDTWRWKIFSGEVPLEKWNSEYWRQKLQIVGVSPSVNRDTHQDLDAAAIFHVANGYDMIRYFTRTIMQYQFADSLCTASGHVGPLHECDFYNSTAAGHLLSRMLSMGASRPWPDAMEAITGQRRMSAKALLKYFEPLTNWLKKENARNKEQIGWEVR